MFISIIEPVLHLDEKKLMLLRAYRLTDKFALFLLKGSAALASLAAEGALMVLGSPDQNRGVLGLLARIVRLILAVILLILTGIGSVLSVLFRFAGGAANVAAVGARRVSGQATTGVGGAMARRAARAEMETGLAEDPLRVQNRMLSTLVVVVLFLLIGTVILATVPRNDAPTPGTGGNNLLFNNTPAPTNAPVVFSTAIPTATQLPDALQVRGSIAYVYRENGQTDLWAIPVGSRTPLRITNDAADERDPSWSPDGRRLAYASNRNNNWDIYIYDLAANETRRITFGLTFEANPSWSPDSVWLAYESYQENNLDIYILPAVDDPSLVLQRLPASSEFPDFAPAWSPLEGTNGRYIAFVSWIDGSQDIYLFSLDTQELTNLTKTPERQEDFPAWSPDGQFIAYSAWDDGREKVFVKSVNNPEAAPELIGFGREPSWSPDGTSIITAVDSVDATHLTVYPYQVNVGANTPIIAVQRGATSPVWTAQPLPVTLVNSGGLSSDLSPLYVEQQSPRIESVSSAPFRLGPISAEAPRASLNERVNDSFNALREGTLAATGIDFLGRLEDAFWDINQRPQPGEPNEGNWFKAGRAFSINRSSALVGFPPPIEVVREDRNVNTYWRVYVRVDEDAQSGQLGEPLRHLSWDFASRTGGDVQAYDAGGKFKDNVPAGYYVDFTQLAADYGWLPIPAGSDWRANVNTINYWAFYNADGLSWLDAMLELYLPSELGGFMPSPTPAPTATTQPES